MVNKNCSLDILDIALVKEWLHTCQEYVDYCKRPFSSVPMKQLWKCKQSNWDAAFKEWTVLQFYFGVLVAIVVLVFEIAGWFDDDDKDKTYIWMKHGSGWVSGCFRIIMAYVMAHLTWFAVVKKNGCFCFFICCCEAPPLLLIWGVLAIVYSIAGIIDAVQMVLMCTFCFIPAVLQAIYSIILFYMGLCSLNIWQSRGSEIVPPAVEVKGPTGETVGAQQL
eukprot:CAMPEP_0206470108 /NCGR_PEP_ID=MMETSP0324_2-20121206/30718_1 /ASSEMBLY_ACC=CAM_ASM_000836 /TAXON_ID=2866 /ORGANISM="Crypthecodinium cohnii, Strain Seligo" /LENGTH=220 /DNA_ID=CAMNT_0053944073 /DNA_START=86 /DNA_END=748 /DNA_ORIENTATION=+